jgi:uncharacterized protein YbjT (DUF2867 family)
LCALLYFLHDKVVKISSNFLRVKIILIRYIFKILLTPILLAVLTASANAQPLSDQWILVTGATGTQGGAVARILIDAGYNVKGLSRNITSVRSMELASLGVQMVEGDFDDLASLDRAFINVYAAFSVQQYRGIGTEREVIQGKAFADAAHRAGISHLIYTSVSYAHLNTGVPQFESKLVIENYIKSIGVPYTIFRPASFMSSLLGLLVSKDTCLIRGPLPETLERLFIAPKDIGVFVEMAITNPNQWIGVTKRIASAQLAYSEITEQFNGITNGCLEYEQIPWDEYIQDVTETDILRESWYLNNDDPFDFNKFKIEYPWVMTFQEFLGEANLADLR